MTQGIPPNTKAVLSFQQYRVVIREQQMWQVHTFLTQVEVKVQALNCTQSIKVKCILLKEGLTYFKLTEPHIISI